VASATLRTGILRDATDHGYAAANRPGQGVDRGITHVEDDTLYDTLWLFVNLGFLGFLRRCVSVGKQE